MLTTYTVISPDGTQTHGDVDFPENPGFHLLRALISPLIGNEPIEHVAVLHLGLRCDMFVSELGHLTTDTRRAPMPLNPSATAIYRNAAMTHEPALDPNTLPTIVGPAVLFDRIVWT